MAVFRVVVPRSLVEVYQRFSGVAAAIIWAPLRWRQQTLSNFGKRLPDYVAQQPGIQPP
jgi:hypothetical protein